MAAADGSRHDLERTDDTPRPTLPYLGELATRALHAFLSAAYVHRRVARSVSLLTPRRRVPYPVEVHISHLPSLSAYPTDWIDAIYRDPNKALLAAVKGKNFRAAQVSLDRGGNPAELHLLFWAAHNNDVEMVRLLLARGSDIRKEESALFESCANGNLAIAQLLLEASAAQANSYIKDIHPDDLIDAVARDIMARDPHLYLGNAQVLAREHISEHLNEINPDLLFIALLRTVARAHPAGIRRRDAVNEVNARMHAHQRRVNEALHYAVASGHLELVQALVDEWHADIPEEHPDFPAEDDNVLTDAARNGDTEIVRFLLARGVRLQQGEDRTLTGAVENGHVETVRLLLDEYRGGQEPDSDTLLRYMIVDNNPAALELAPLFLDRGADPNLALREAARAGNLEMVRLLLDRGVNPNFPRLIQLAQGGNHHAVVELLRERALEAPPE